MIPRVRIFFATARRDPTRGPDGIDRAHVIFMPVVDERAALEAHSE